MNNLDGRITTLEATTKSTDAKIDLVLGKLDEWDTTAKHRGVQSGTVECLLPFI